MLRKLINEGPIDRVLRVVIGLALLTLFFIGPHAILGLLGVVPLVTGAIGYCPLYELFGFTTCHSQHA